MSRLPLLFAVLATSVFAGVLDHPYAELHLNDGRVLHNVHIVGVASTSVMARWDGGRGTIPIEQLPADVRTSAQSLRPAPSTYTVPVARPTPTPTPVAAQPASSKYSGAVFIATRGGDVKRLADVAVYAFSTEFLSRFDTNLTVELPTPLASATTDAEGRFTIEVPAGAQTFLFAQAKRFVGARPGFDPYEHYTWIVKPSDPAHVDLTNDNLIGRPVEVKISEGQ